MFFDKYGIRSRNIILMCLMELGLGLLFFLPIRALYYQQELFTLTNVALIFTIEAIGLMVFEVPSGAVADLFGRKRTLILGLFMTFVGISFLFVGGSMFFFILFALFSSFGRSLMSGTDSALIYDTLKEEKKEEYFKKIIGIYQAVWPFGAAIGSILGGYMAVVSLRLPVGLTLIPIGLCILVMFFVKEPDYKKENHHNVFKHVFYSSKLAFQNKQILIILSGILVIVGVGEAVHLLNPIFFQVKEVPLAFFGYLGAFVFGFSALGHYFSHDLSEKLGDKRVLIFAAFMSPALLVIAVLTPHPAAALIFSSASLFYGIRMPIISNFINKDAPSSKRATMISISNFAGQIGVAVFMPFVGYFADLYTINTAYLISAGIMLVGIVLWCFLKDKK